MVEQGNIALLSVEPITKIAFISLEGWIRVNIRVLGKLIALLIVTLETLLRLIMIGCSPIMF
jgi:hypothetical protein